MATQKWVDARRSTALREPHNCKIHVKPTSFQVLDCRKKQNKTQNRITQKLKLFLFLFCFFKITQVGRKRDRGREMEIAELCTA